MFKSANEQFLGIEAGCRYPISSLFLPILSLTYDNGGPPITQRASRTRKYPEMARDRTTQDYQGRRDTEDKDFPPRDTKTREEKPQHNRLRHSLTFIGIGMIISLLLVVAAQFTGNWVSNMVDDWRYGNPRTFQIDAFVGHETGKEPSHFMALNLHGRIQIIEFPGSDGTKAKIYLGPQLYDVNADRIPVKLQFVDVHHNHQPDMYVQVGNTQVVFRNTAGGFQSP